MTTFHDLDEHLSVVVEGAADSLLCVASLALMLTPGGDHPPGEHWVASGDLAVSAIAHAVAMMESHMPEPPPLRAVGPDPRPMAYGPDDD